MGKTGIEWTEMVWNVVTGCTPASPGCEHCYARRMAHRLAGRVGYPVAPHEFAVTLHPERLDEPRHWKQMRSIFVCSMGDLFHELVPDDYIRQVFEVMQDTKQHVFQVLTKRPANALRWFTDYPWLSNLRNVWVGVTVEDQTRADERIPLLLQIPAAVRFISVEPMLSAINLREWLQCHFGRSGKPIRVEDGRAIYGARLGPRVDWVICGGETGPQARPINPAWVRQLRDQCIENDAPFFFKNWGGPHREGWVVDGKLYSGNEIDGIRWTQHPVANQGWKALAWGKVQR